MDKIGNRKKLTCLNCRVSHVICNFGSINLQVDKLVCLFCKIKIKNSSKIDSLKERVFTLEQNIAILENKPKCK